MSTGALTRFDRSWSLAVDAATTRVLATNPVSRRGTFVEAGATDVRVRVARRDGADVVSSTRTVSTGAPGIAASVVGRSLTLVQTEWWGDPDDTGGVTARLQVEFPGRPFGLRAAVAVRPTPTGCLYRVAGEAEARVPVMGVLLTRQIAQRALADLARHLPAAPAAMSAVRGPEASSSRRRRTGVDQHIPGGHR